MIAVDAAIKTLHVSIDHALAVSYRRNAYDPSSAYVAHITLVKGTPFYGYHVGYRFFLKIYLLSPQHITRVADLLRQGAVMKRVLQPYESHLQFISQWMCDYNLHGCSYINCRQVKFRQPVPVYAELENPDHRWHNESIPPESISDSNTYPRQSHCTLEVDIHVQDIMNRDAIKERRLHHDFSERNLDMSPDEKLVSSLAGLWEDERRRRRVRMGLTSPESSPFTNADLVSMSADPRNTSAGGWIHEEEYRERINNIVEDEHPKRKETLSFSSFLRPDSLEGSVKTALESVQDLFPQNLHDPETHALQPGAAVIGGSQGNVEVDEDMILSFGLNEEFLGLEDGVDNVHAQSDEDSQSQVPTDENHTAAPESASDFPNIERIRQRRLAHNNFMAPLSNSGVSTEDLESLGIRKYSDPINSQEDVFEIDDEFISKITRRPNNSPRPAEMEQSPSNKLKLTNTPTIYPPHSPHSGTRRPRSFSDRALDTKSQVSEGEPSSQISLSQKSNKDGTRKIQFPVVKDPYDPATISRFSQKSQLSEPSHPVSGENSPSSEETLNQSRFNLVNGVAQRGAPGQNDTTPCSSLRDQFSFPDQSKIYSFRPQCPTPSYVKDTIAIESGASVVYRNAYYSNQDDVPDRAREYAGREFKLESDTLPYLPPFDPTCSNPALFGEKHPVIIDRANLERQNEKMRQACSIRTWEFAPTAPTSFEVAEWAAEEEYKDNLEDDSPPKGPTTFNVSQIEGPTQRDGHGFKYSQRRKSANIQHETHYMSVMSLEVHANTRGSLAPSPDEDEISCIFWRIQSENPGHLQGCEDSHSGIVVVSDTGTVSTHTKCHPDFEVEEELTELDLINKLVSLVRYHDPDILTGYEVHNGSWGFVIERARSIYEYDLCDELSRVKSLSHGRFGKEADRWGFNHTSTIRVTGRHMINIWRAMRGELNLLQYSMENVVFHLLHRRIPHYPFHVLTEWYKSDKPRDVTKVFNYFVSRVKLDLEIMDANELVSRTSEQARILGIDFFSVFSRGSQFKVESLMFRIAKPENFILISPSRDQVGQQNALECLPLVMEPQSDFYTSPVLVLDFQSLYPSVMIAYNYCYSTYLGRIVNWRGRNKMGVTDYQRELGLLELLKDQINIAPNGVMYAKQETRKSLLAKMLSEILETRVMVKNGMKEDKDDRPLQRLLNNRQLALKLIANVTYGYTSASFSGRMPCAEIADSIVQTGRETLEKAIALIHSEERWGAEVVYGDTDSLFIHLKGRTRDEAFDIGEDIARTITNVNPQPIKLKFEKVYHPCVLLAKKRYVGYKYESRNQKIPEFDAKGIETVRRDGTPAEQKIEEKALKILFETADLSRVKKYFQKQCTKIMQGKISVQDFCFAKEVKLGTYSDRGVPPPGALISAKRMIADPRLEPQYGERVPYVVVSGAPGARLVERCVAPEVLLENPQLDLDSEYYISKNIIPPLERIFNLVGANVRQWYDELPKYQRIRRTEGGRAGTMQKRTLESYMKSSSCVVCRDKLNASNEPQFEQQQHQEQPICKNCLNKQPHQSLLELNYRIKNSERKVANLNEICRSCMGVAWAEEVRCDSQDCPVFYSRMRQTADLRHKQATLEPVARILESEGDSNDWLTW